MTEFGSLLPLVFIVGIFWFLVIRPASRRNRDLARLQGSLTPGDEVMLSSGFFGTLISLVDDRAHVELAEGVVVQVSRAAISKVVGPAAADDVATEEP